MSSKPITEEEIQAFKLKKSEIKEELRIEAGFLTRSLYRTCLRSVRLIRPGNQRDEEEFQEREKRRMEEEESLGNPSNNDDVRMGMFSMLPPVDRDDELRSRADYYHQYARENFAQELDVMPLHKGAVGELMGQDVEKFVFLLKKGEQDRKWLLQDMEFPDLYQSSFLKDRLDHFQEKAMDYVYKNQMTKQGQTGQSLYYQQDVADDDAEDDGSSFWGADEEVPQWILDKYPHINTPKSR